MKILNHKQIHQKIKRVAFEILENNFQEKEIILAGINNAGLELAQLLVEELLEISELDITVTRISLNPAKPISEEIVLEIPPKNVKEKVVIVVDDVANTGRTIFYAIKPFLDILPKKLEVAVLVDRKHKSFPIKVNYIGLSLATTVKENIDVRIRDVEEKEVFLV